MSTVPATGEVMVAIERARRLSNRLSRLLQERLGASVYQIGILAAVEEGARRLHEVAETTGQQASGASRLVDRLVTDGLLDRRPDPDDRRALVLALTPAGDRLLSDARTVVGGVMGEATQRMPVDDARRLLPVLDSFLDAAEAMLDEADAVSRDTSGTTPR